MGKSTGCLRIITCGGGSIIEANEADPVDQVNLVLFPNFKLVFGFRVLMRDCDLGVDWICWWRICVCDLGFWNEMCGFRRVRVVGEI